MTVIDEVSNIDSLLDAMQRHVLRGEYAELAAMLPAFEENAGQIAPDDSASALHQLRAKAARNAACLEAAITGIRAGQRRLAEIALAGRGLSTYDRSGEKRLLDTARDSGLRF